MVMASLAPYPGHGLGFMKSERLQPLVSVRGLGLHRGHPVRRHSGRLTIGHADEWIALQPGGVALIKVPVQRVEGTSGLFQTLLLVLGAALAVVAHAVKVSGTAHIRLGGRWCLKIIDTFGSGPRA